MKFPSRGEGKNKLSIGEGRREGYTYYLSVLGVYIFTPYAFTKHPLVSAVYTAMSDCLSASFEP